MMRHRKIEDKIAKLLRLATSDNPHEAALAAAKAQELILQYNVDEEELLKSGDQKVEVEPIGEEALGSKTGRVPVWHGQLAMCMQHSFMVKTYTARGLGIYVIGRATNRAAFIATWKYVRDQVKNLADRGWIKQEAQDELNGLVQETWWGRDPHQPKTWKHSFCIGAVVTVAERLSADIKKLEAGFQPVDSSGQASGMVLFSSKALVLKSRNDEVASWTKLNKKLFKIRSNAPRSTDAYHEGKKAGYAVNLEKKA